MDKFNELVHKQPALTAVFESIHDIVLILDEHRKIVYFNNKFRKFADKYNLTASVGISPGNAFHCIQAIGGDNLCGTTDLCRYCGGNSVIESSRHGEKAASQCFISALNGNAFTLNVSASPLTVDKQDFIIYCITDSSGEERKQALEKIFFHDVNNIVNGMGLIIDMVREHGGCSEDDFNSHMELLSSAMNSLKNEIHSQYILSLAEKDELSIFPQSTAVGAVIKDICRFFNSSISGNGVTVRSKNRDIDSTIVTDPVILRRVLVNMVKNSCEASHEGNVVTISHKINSKGAVITVHNDSVMSEEVSKFIFKRSFSTKGKGRGLGTYSMRLLTERYLKGDIYFHSEEGKGTTFYLELPLNPPD